MEGVMDDLDQGGRVGEAESNAKHLREKTTDLKILYVREGVWIKKTVKSLVFYQTPFGPPPTPRFGLFYDKK